MGRYFFILLAFIVLPAAQADPQIEQPRRTHGYFIGDVLLQRVNLDSMPDALNAQDIESEQRIDDYLYRMPVNEVTIKNQRWLELRYQIINAPRQTETIALPAISLITEAGEEHLIAPWSFTVAPLTSTTTDSVLLPDRRALDVIEPHDNSKLKLSIAALLTTLALWLLWWVIRHFSDSHTLAFAKANRTINKLPAAGRDSDPQAWVALHHAFNDTAGKTISSSTLPQLFSAAPWLTAYKEPIENFYSASSARFYKQEDSQTIGVSALCADLYRAEKRQAKQARSAAGKQAQ